MFRRLLAPRSIAALILTLSVAPAALSWSIAINSASRRVYLHVGNGVAAGNSGTINLVSVTVPATLYPMMPGSTGPSLRYRARISEPRLIKLVCVFTST